MAEPKLPPGWELHHYQDEVVWFHIPSGFPAETWIVKYPFVPGFFVAMLLAEEHADDMGVSHPIAGPFKTVLDAIAAINLIQT